VRRRALESARDELQELDRQKSRFTANVHHELRTPLTLMLAPLEALRSGDLGEVPVHLGGTLRTMHSNGLRLLKLINNLLDLAKIEGEQLGVRRVTMDVGPAIAEVVEGARALADRKGVDLRTEGLGDLQRVNADPDALEKVVVNLVGNALKFTDHGSVAVVGSWLEADDEWPEGAVQVTVHDTGAGIPEDQLERVFDRFAQVDGSATRRHEGTGIGLSLVTELVGLHGGRVWAESPGLGLGTSMHFVLPVGEPDADVDEEVMLAESDGRVLDAKGSFQALASEVSLDLAEGEEGRFVEMERSVERWEGQRESAELAGLPEHPAGTPEVVIAEDNAEMRRLLAVLIGSEFSVRPTRNGREALESVRQRAPDLVVTDVMMPEMSGTELCRALKGDPGTQGIPVMLVTSKAEREMKIEGLELGADDYVTKPFHPRELVARVRSLVRVRQLQGAVEQQNAMLERRNEELQQALRDLRETEVQLVQSERLAAVGELSAGVAHEVNNPLNFVRNSVMTLGTYVEDVRSIAEQVGALDASDPERLARQLDELEAKKTDLHFEEMADDLAELIAIVTDGLDRTSKLVSDLRDFAAPHQGEQVPVDVAANLRSTLLLVGYALREAGASVELDLPEGLPLPMGDPGALNQVFLNLLKNASDAIETVGRGAIRVGAAEEGGELVVRVQDDGPGMDSEVKSRLFEPFFTTKEAGRGTGLGLSMCRRIVHEHGGEIEVESEAGQGALFRVRLPIPERRGTA
jgi:signal transduction histidine kinase